MENLERILSEHTFLHGLDPNYLKLITGCAQNVRFDAGQYLFREGEEANWFYIIRQGKIAIEAFAAQRGSIIIDTIEDGDVVGWSWIVPPYQWHFDAQAVEVTKAIALDGRCLRMKCEQDHTLGFELLKRFSQLVEQRLEATRMRLLDVYGVQP